MECNVQRLLRTATASAAPSATGGDRQVYRVQVPGGGARDRRLGKAWKFTSNSWEYTGDGIALALDAGADLIDMECVQFHPTGMVWPPSVRGILVTEGVRGDGGYPQEHQERTLHVQLHPRVLRAETADTSRKPTAGTRTRRTTAAPPTCSARRSRPRDQYRGEGRAGHAPRRRVPRHRVAGGPPTTSGSAAQHVPPVQGAGRGRHHREADGSGADLPLHHGRRPGRRRQRGVDGARTLRGRRGRRGHARREPARRQLALRPARLRPTGRPVRGRVREALAGSPPPDGGQVDAAVRAMLAPLERTGREPYTIQPSCRIACRSSSASSGPRRSSSRRSRRSRAQAAAAPGARRRRAAYNPGGISPRSAVDADRSRGVHPRGARA